ncbi:hypothetical protein A6456_38215 [Paraburkholderia tropica]|nr:hypothetical protein A6456_38215 [Paraburkholderia tropica]
MNWRRLYATMDLCITVGLFAAFIAAFWAFFLTGICRFLFHRGDSTGMQNVFVPAAILLFLLLVKLLPRWLRKMGLLNDSPSRFGLWFK